jgi:Protein of unknown function (DUF2924)
MQSTRLFFVRDIWDMFLLAFLPSNAFCEQTVFSSPVSPIIERFAAKQLENCQIRTLEVDHGVRPGMRLVREWRGRLHTVIVTQEGFEFAGRTSGASMFGNRRGSQST